MRKYMDKEYLEEEYLKKGRSCGSLALECGVSRMTISRWLRLHGIKARSQKEARWVKYHMTMEEALEVLNEFSCVDAFMNS